MHPFSLKLAPHPLAPQMRGKGMYQCVTCSAIHVSGQMTPGDQGPAFSRCRLLLTWYSGEEENRAALQAIENNFADTTLPKPPQTYLVEL